MVIRLGGRRSNERPLVAWHAEPPGYPVVLAGGGMRPLRRASDGAAITCGIEPGASAGHPLPWLPSPFLRDVGRRRPSPRPGIDGAAIQSDVPAPTVFVEFRLRGV